ncbi:hypothetical protein [Neisseria mucosa]|uniref:hypothetical protein n=1 Tax=Neisseria mucosa TaxID=488 RepID=UPI00051D5DB5|nr:hypothetical protein [Neisseria mucosa]KGJ32176.1 hypothetical protein ES17_05165 [Neisseria mucosa]
MYELIAPEFVTGQKITSIFRNAYIDIKEERASDSGSYLWTIGLGSEDVLIGFEPEEKRLDIGKNTILGNYNEFENNERFILNLINKMNEKFFIRSYIKVYKEQDKYVFSVRAGYKYNKGFHPAYFINECRFLVDAYNYMLYDYLTSEFKQEGIWND